MTHPMIERVTLDQLRTFIAAADEGSFSAAARRLRRAQSVVSQTLANLEGQLGISLFDRTRRYPALTEQGHALLASARAVADRVDEFKGRARALAGGLEPELSVVIDVLFPMDVVTDTFAAFRRRFPGLPLRLFVEALGAVVQPVLDRRCQFGLMGSLPLLPPDCSGERVLSVDLIGVVAPMHPLAALRGPVPLEALSEHVQLVLTDRSELTKGREFGVLSPRTWRLSDLGAKHAFLRAGFGWGTMPGRMVAADLADGRLVQLQIEDRPTVLVMPMYAVFLADRPPGPAGRWLIDRFKESAQAGLSDSPAALPPPV